METTKTTLSFLILFLLTGFYPTFASDTAYATFSGTVSNIQNITVGNLKNNLSIASEETDVKIFDYSINSNGANGFTLTLSSENGGQLRHTTGYSSLKPATYTGYTISIVPVVSGGASTAHSLTGLNLSIPESLDFFQDAPTDAKVWDVNITHPSKILFSGAYEDTITLTISNI